MNLFETRELLPIGTLAIMAVMTVVAAVKDMSTASVVVCSVLTLISAFVYWLITFTQSRPELYNIPFDTKTADRNQVHKATNTYIYRIKTLTILSLGIFTVSESTSQSIHAGLIIASTLATILAATAIYCRKLKRL